jgi:hypothetical protein
MADSKKAQRRETVGTTAGFDFNTSECVEFAIDRRTRLQGWHGTAFGAAGRFMQ